MDQIDSFGKNDEDFKYLSQGKSHIYDQTAEI
jgi:hypothetical protein